LIYQYNGSWKKIKSLNANLIKRQKNGVQSSVRFSRLSEESRYIVRVIDWIDKFVITKANNYIFGSRELKDMLISSQTIKIKFMTSDIYYQFDDRTILDPYFRQLMINP
jgi:hypothetical protein